MSGLHRVQQFPPNGCTGILRLVFEVGVAANIGGYDAVRLVQASALQVYFFHTASDSFPGCMME